MEIAEKLTKGTTVGIGVANDLCEPGMIQLVNRLHAAGLCNYLVVYVYENYTHEFLRSVRSQLPSTLQYVWHTSGDFELPFDGPSIEVNWDRIQRILDIWQPVWMTEDVIVSNFARTRPQGQPSYVQPFLTVDCLRACIQRMEQIARRLTVPLLPEIPHFYMPGPDEMHVSTFFRRFVDATGAMLNFDLGHFFSYNLLNRRSPLYRIDEFPLEFVSELHTAGGMVGDPEGLTWVDDYAGPLHSYVEDALRWLIPRCPNLRAVYTETIGAEEWVLYHNLEKLNEVFPVNSRHHHAFK